MMLNVKKTRSSSSLRHALLCFAPKITGFHLDYFPSSRVISVSFFRFICALSLKELTGVEF